MSVMNSVVNDTPLPDIARSPESVEKECSVECSNDMTWFDENNTTTEGNERGLTRMAAMMIIYV